MGRWSKRVRLECQSAWKSSLFELILRNVGESSCILAIDCVLEAFFGLCSPDFQHACKDVTQMLVFMFAQIIVEDNTWHLTPSLTRITGGSEYVSQI